MTTYLYFSMTPESLVASMLPPEEFGTYLAIGARKSAHGQAMFFDLKQGFLEDIFDLSSVPQRCVPHPDGRPKCSAYLAVYRVLERIPLAALNRLWLVAPKGQVMERKSSLTVPEFEDTYYLYQEICPVHPLVISSLSPAGFTSFLTNPQTPVSVPRICFVDLDLGELAKHPERAQPPEVIYPDHFYHLRECALELKHDPTKHTKTVDRLHPHEFPFRQIRHGFYVGDQHGMLHYPFPSRNELEGEYYYWWRPSAHVPNPSLG